MMEIPFSLAKKYHRLMWRWLARHPKTKKNEWPGMCVLEAKYGDTSFECFACEIAMAAKGCADSGEHFCEYCPLIGWAGKPVELSPTRCGNKDSKYLKWLYERDCDASSKLAMEIANAEWITEEEFNAAFERNHAESWQEEDPGE